MLKPITKEYIQKAMELLDWPKRDQFILAEKLSAKQLANALTYIAPGVKKEEVVALRDDTLLQNGKKGVLVTADKIYFHGHYRFSAEDAPNYIDYLRLKGVHDDFLYLESFRLVYRDESYVGLYCNDWTKQFFDFFCCMIQLNNANFGEEEFFIDQLLAESRVRRMKQIFEPFSYFRSAEQLSAKNISVLKKHLYNPVTEQIVAFEGIAQQYELSGLLFTTERYYQLGDKGVRECYLLEDILDVYPNHSDTEMAAFLKSGEMVPLYVGAVVQDDYEQIFEGIRDLLNPSTDALKRRTEATPESEAAKVRVIRLMSSVRTDSVNSPYKGYPNARLMEMYHQQEAAGGSAELPIVCDMIAFYSSPPADSYYYARAFLYYPLSRYSLSWLYYYLYCLKNKVRWREREVRNYNDPDYRAFIEHCNQTPLEDVRAELRSELERYRSVFE